MTNRISDRKFDIAIFSQLNIDIASFLKVWNRHISNLSIARRPSSAEATAVVSRSARITKLLAFIFARVAVRAG